MRIIFLIFFNICYLFSQVKTNEELIDSLSTHIITKALKSAPCKPKFEYTNINSLELRNYLNNKVTELTPRFTTNEDCPAENFYTFQDCSIEYKPIIQQNISKKEYVRTVNIVLYGRDTNNTVKLFPVVYSDYIIESDIALIENKDIAYTFGIINTTNNLNAVQGKQAEKSTFQKAVEPAILTVISGIIVYLFYSVRSD